MSNEYYSHGKLLISGEYFVLEGSLAFALPLKLGQSMKVNEINNSKNELIWETTLKNEPWFHTKFDLNSLDVVETTEMEKALYIQNNLKQIQQTRKALNVNGFSLQIKTNLEFPVEWGLGSSSSLISNLAYWAKTNPYELFFKTLEGSGYDIACARSESPILYQLNGEPFVQKTKFEPDFLDHIYFVYLGKKQNTLTSVLKYREKIKKEKTSILRITEITKCLIQSEKLEDFNEYINEHELIVSKSINQPTVKSQYFNDFQGAIKSLGAWGGDFIMAAYQGDKNYVEEYFKSKGLTVIFRYKDLVL